MRTGVLLPIAAAGLFSVAGVANALVIDTFNGTGPFEINAPQTNTSVGNSSAGYARTLTATTSGSSTNVQIDTTTNTGVFAHSQSSGVTGYSRIDYALGGIDLTGNDPVSGKPFNAFNMVLAGADLSGTIGMIVNGVTQSLGTTPIIFAAGGLPASAIFLYSSFSGVDFTNVTTASIFINGNATAALDVSIDAIGSVCSTLTANGGTAPNASICQRDQVPVPAPLWMLGAGLFGLGAVRRRFSRG